MMPVFYFLITLLGAVFLIWFALRRKRFDSIPSGSMVYGDLHSKGAVLKSRTYRLTGKPDMVIRKGRSLIPYEYKHSDSPSPREGHLLQMGAYFLILEDLNPGFSVPYGVLKYKSTAFRVKNTPDLRGKVLYKSDLIRRTTTEPARNHDNPRKCISCPFKASCDQSLIITQYSEV
ncbi:MAG: PD-(D/E)XK nuclease family protein [Thermoplasmataceae archaeon]|jgi:CRISPR-associated exonuclease Cas4